jgi:hypothetical protein
MTELPHPEANKTLGTFKSGEFFLNYYENPRTTGSVVAGIDAAYIYPQVAVISRKDFPLLMIRIEASASGGSFLCSLDATGKHSNFGPCAAGDRDSFIKKAGEIIRKIKSG